MFRRVFALCLGFSFKEREKGREASPGEACRVRRNVAGRIFAGTGDGGGETAMTRGGKAVLVSAAVLAAAGAVLVVRAMTSTSKQVAVLPAAETGLDGRVLAQRLSDALRHRTVSVGGTREPEWAEFQAFREFLARAFPRVHAALERREISQHSLLYRWRGARSGQPPVLLLAHTDVVPAEPATESLWAHPPFAGHVENGVVWGRGALDDKCSLMAILEAAEHLLRSGFRPGPDVYFAFGHDEETGGRGAQAMAEVLERLGARPGLVLDEGGAVVEGALPGGAAVALVGIAEKGFANVELRVSARGGHSSAPPAETAIGILARALSRLEAHPMPRRLTGAVEQFFHWVGPELPFPYRIALANLWLFEPVLVSVLARSPTTGALVGTTAAPTIIRGGVKDNVLPTSARAVVNYRILPGDSVRTVLEHVRAVVGDPRVQIRTVGPVSEPSPESPTDSAAFRLLARAIRETFPGVPVAPYLTLGATDARHYARISRNIYRFAPLRGTREELARMHGIDEQIAVTVHRKAVEFYVRLFHAIDGLAEP